MATKQGNIKYRNGDVLIPNSTTNAILDVEREQALAVTLLDKTDKEALGYPAFATTSAYVIGDKVYYKGKLYKFTADKSAGAWDASKVTATSVKEILGADITSEATARENADTVLAAAIAAEETARTNAVNAEAVARENADALLNAQKANIDGYYKQLGAGFADTASELNVNGTSLAKHTQVYAYETTGGNISVKDGKGYVVAMRGTAQGANINGMTINSIGFNLIPSGSGTVFTFPVVEGVWGEYGSADENNGYLFTDANGQIIVPLSVVQNGESVPTHIHNGVTYYLPSSNGNIVVTFASSKTNPCCHVCWSNYRDTDYETYNKSSIALGSLSFGDKILRRVNGGNTFVADEINFPDKKGYRRVGSVVLKNLTWSVTSETTEGATTYKFTAPVAGGIISADAMKVDGLYAVKGLSGLSADIDGNTMVIVSTTITNVNDLKTALGNAVVEYELNDVAIYTFSSLTNELTISDFGIIYITNTANQSLFDIDFEFNIAWSDTLKNMMPYIETEGKVIATALNDINARVSAIERNIRDGFLSLRVENLVIGNTFKGVSFDDGDDMARTIVRSTSPNIIPKFIGQRWIDTTNKKEYVAFGDSATTDWNLIN